ncbi:MAG TPA: AMP-binding protein, partial [Rhizomicrobium sp.]|nr:AMP-binding protein [Rhizomicrobium sp.]
MASRKGGKRTAASRGKTSKPAKTKKPARKKVAAAKKPPRTAKAAARSVPKPVQPRGLRKPKSFVRRGAAAALRLAQRLKPVLGRSPYNTDLDRNSANYQSLTPLTFLERAAKTFPDRIAIVHGKQRFTYAQFFERSKKLASALSRRGIGKGDTVAVMLANTPPMLEAHYGVPMTGGVLNTLNTRLDAAALAFILDHGEAKVLITDREFAPTIKETLKLARVKPIVIDYDDLEFPQSGEKLGEIDYESFVTSGDVDFAPILPGDEWDAISLNYTSGTTGNPKGVVFHHRGAALMGYGNVISANMPRHPVYLWTLPMFHCNGWCFPWSLSVLAGTHICLRWVRA